MFFEALVVVFFFKLLAMISEGRDEEEERAKAISTIGQARDEEECAKTIADMQWLLDSGHIILAP